MQFDPLRAFPYPVLRPDIDDYVDGAMDVVINHNINTNEKTISINFNFSLSVQEIASIIDLKSAEYLVVVSCRDTYFRKTIRSFHPNISEIFSDGDIRGEVVLYPFIVTNNKIEKFSCKWINSEFGKGPFTFDSGAILALAEPQKLYVERERFNKITSFFTLVKDDSVGKHVWRLDCDTDKIRIVVSSYLKKKIDNARNDNVNISVLVNSIYFAATVQCLIVLKEGEVLEQKWAKFFKQRILELDIDLEKEDETWVAQELMNCPISQLDKFLFSEAEKHEN